MAGVPGRTIQIETNIDMAKKKYPPTADRIAIFTAAWREIAPDASFGGMTLAEFETATAPLGESIRRLQALEVQTSGEIRNRDVADEAARGLLRLVAHSVRGEPAFGENSQLYRAMGFVPLSERQSGLTRKGTEPADGEQAA